MNIESNEKIIKNVYLKILRREPDKMDLIIILIYFKMEH